MLARDLAHHGILRLVGGDRVRFLNGLVSNDVKALAPGDACRAALLTVKGRVLGDMLVLATDDALVLDVAAGATDKTREALEHHLIADDVTIEDASSSLAVLGVYGDDAAAAVARALDAPAVATLAAMRHVEAGGVRALRLVELGRPALRLYGAADAIARVRDTLGATILDEERYETLRIEAGEPRYGVEIGEDHLPGESRLDDAISFGKGCFLGQEVVVRLRDQGHLNWRLMGLRLDGGGAAPRGAKLSTPSRPDAGTVTSSVVSERFGPIALGFVHRSAFAPGTEVLVDGTRRATVTELPFGA